jgi:hypothetical protein
LENYKIQLGKYHKNIINEGKPEGSELITDSVILDHKSKLQKNFQDKNVDGMVEVLLSLRVNSLQIAPELRKSLVSALVSHDILMINKDFDFILALLNYDHDSMKHAITSLVSVISSNVKGVEYLTTQKNMVKFLYISV